MEQPDAYTLARWHVKPGKEDQFVTEWERLASVFSALPAPPLWGTLIRSETDPSLFFSFGPWRRGEDIGAMRANPSAQEGLRALGSLCIEAAPGAYRLVKHIRL